VELSISSYIERDRIIYTMMSVSPIISPYSAGLDPMVLSR
jgi:hypothetical protein